MSIVPRSKSIRLLLALLFGVLVLYGIIFTIRGESLFIHNFVVSKDFAITQETAIKYSKNALLLYGLSENDIRPEPYQGEGTPIYIKTDVSPEFGSILWNVRSQNKNLFINLEIREMENSTSKKILRVSIFKRV